MSTSSTEIQEPIGIELTIDDETLAVDLTDGRTISVPIAWFPRLVHASLDEKNNWRWIGKGSGIHWPDLDEDISVENLLDGKRSGESQASFKRWLEGREGQLPPA